MAALFMNFGAGTTSTLISGVALSLPSAGLAAVQVIASPDYMDLTLDPLSEHGAPEVVGLTVHAGSASSGTIERGKYDTTAREHPAGTTWCAGVYAINIADTSRTLGPLLLSTPTTATLMARLARLPVAGGFIEVDEAVVLDDVFDAEDQPFHLRGNGRAASIMTVPGGGADVTTITCAGGQQQKISDLTLVNDFAGTRTTYDIDIVNPWYTVLSDVELQLSESALQKGGIIIRKDVGEPNSDRCFQPTLRDVFIRNGVLVIDGVTDGQIIGGYIWGTYTNAPGTVEWRSSSGGWMVQGLSVVPSINAGHCVTGGLTSLSILGGQFDGSSAGIQTGPGFKVLDTGGAYMRSLSIIGTHIYSHWGTALDFYDVRDCVVRALFKNNNKGDISAPEIRLRSSKLCKFDSAHIANIARTNPGLLYTEDSGSAHNYVTGIVEAVDNGYLDPFVSAQATTVVTGGQTL